MWIHQEGDLSYQFRLVISFLLALLYSLKFLQSSVLALDESALDVDQVDNLIKVCPTKEEMELLKVKWFITIWLISLKSLIIVTIDLMVSSNNFLPLM